MFVHVTKVDYLTGYRIRLRFDNGIVGEIDLTDQLFGEIFEPLKDKKFFKKVKVDKLAGTIAWENGADFAPEYLFKACKKIK